MKSASSRVAPAAPHPGDSFSNICKHLHETFRISHATVQVETDPDHRCALAPDHVV
jgi:cobalt-zinc-cadmium efflux system protein